MSTATIPAVTPPVTPIAADLTSIFYGPDTNTASTAPITPPVVSDPGSTVTPAASTVSPDMTKPHESPVGTETPVKPAEATGHAAAARRLGQEVASLKQESARLAEENRILKAKADGTYEEPHAPTSEQVEARAEFRGRETASRAVADGLFGTEAVKTRIYDEGSEYQQLITEQPWLHARVVKAAQPAVEAMRVLNEQAFLAQYGTDATQWVAKIEAELTPKLLEKFKTQAATPMTGHAAPTVTEARGAGGSARERSLEETFYGKSRTA